MALRAPIRRWRSNSTDLPKWRHRYPASRATQHVSGCALRTPHGRLGAGITPHSAAISAVRCFLWQRAANRMLGSTPSPFGKGRGGCDRCNQTDNVTTLQSATVIAGVA